LSAEPLHPILEAATRGILPPWAEVGERRLAHMERVARLMEQWARALALGNGEVRRWRAAGFLHDALRDAPPERLRAEVPREFRGLLDSLLHGPAAAERLRLEGVTDGPFLRAVACHSLGHPGLDRMGRALFAADVLEPGRTYRPRWRRALRKDFPLQEDAVVLQVLQARIRRGIEKGHPLHDETVAFWNAVGPGAREARVA
jgi:HD superfamily phosphohydrolase YqeK